MKNEIGWGGGVVIFPLTHGVWSSHCDVRGLVIYLLTQGVYYVRGMVIFLLTRVCDVRGMVISWLTRGVWCKRAGHILTKQLPQIISCCPSSQTQSVSVFANNAQNLENNNKMIFNFPSFFTQLELHFLIAIPKSRCYLVILTSLLHELKHTLSSGRKVIWELLYSFDIIHVCFYWPALMVGAS